MTHSGRPNGNKDKKFTLRPVAKELESLLGTKVNFIDDCIGEEALERTQTVRNGEVL